MISLKLIKKEHYDQLVNKDTHLLQQINQLFENNNLLYTHLEECKNQYSQLLVQKDVLITQNKKNLNQISEIRRLLCQKNAECINLKSSIQAYKVEKCETEIKVNELKSFKNQIQIRFADLKGHQKDCLIELGNLKQLNQEYQNTIRSFESDISALNQRNIQLQIKYDILQQNLKKQNQRSEQQALQIQKLSYQKSTLQSIISKVNELPQAKLKQKLEISQQWIKQLTKQYNQLKQKFVEKDIEKLNLGSGNSGKLIYKSNEQDFQRAKYVQLCKTLLNQFNSKIQKIQKQKQKVENKYKIISLKLNQYQYNQFKYKDKISLYLQKIEGYQKLASKQQNELQKIINQFDTELDNIVKLKQSEMQKKIQQMDTFKINILEKQLETLQQDLKKLKKQKKKNNQTIVLLQQDNYNKTIQIRKLKGYNHDLITQLQIRTNEVQLLKTKISSNGSHTNRSQQQLLSTISRLSNKNTNGRLSSGQEKYQYEISEIDTENQRKNENLMKMCSPAKYYKSNSGVPDLIKQDPKRLQQSLISESSSSNSNDSSQYLGSNQSLNNSCVSKGSSKSYVMKQNYSYKSKLNLNSKFLLHKNSLK